MLVLALWHSVIMSFNKDNVVCGNRKSQVSVNVLYILLGELLLESNGHDLWIYERVDLLNIDIVPILVETA